MTRLPPWLRWCVWVTVLALGLAGCDDRNEGRAPHPQDPVNQEITKARSKAWQGTITVHTTAAGAFPDESNNRFSTTEHSITESHTANLDVSGTTRASLRYERIRDSRFHDDYDAYTISGTGREVISASGPSPEARVSIEFFEGGRYTIDFSARGIDGSGHVTSKSMQRCKPGGKDPECRDRPNETDETYPVPNLASVSGGVEGRIDRTNRYRLSGSESYPYEPQPGVAGRTVVSWSLERPPRNTPP